METMDTTAAVFLDHLEAENGVKKLSEAGFDIKKLSIIGKGYHSEEKVIGFYNIGQRMTFWGRQGAFWGGFWGLFFGGVFITVPVIGQVVVLGYLATAVISAIESAVVVGGISAIGAALYSVGIPKDTIIEYEAALLADGFIILVHGTAEEAARAQSVLSVASAARVETHTGTLAGGIPGKALQNV